MPFTLRTGRGGNYSGLLLRVKPFLDPLWEQILNSSLFFLFLFHSLLSVFISTCVLWLLLSPTARLSPCRSFTLISSSSDLLICPAAVSSSLQRGKSPSPPQWPIESWSAPISLLIGWAARCRYWAVAELWLLSVCCLSLALFRPVKVKYTSGWALAYFATCVIFLSACMMANWEEDCELFLCVLFSPNSSMVFRFIAGKRGLVWSEKRASLCWNHNKINFKARSEQGLCLYKTPPIVNAFTVPLIRVFL